MLEGRKEGRIVWLDYVKAVGMYFVLLGHAYPFLSPPCYVRNAIYLFHMPLFYFVSGMLFSPPPLLQGGVEKPFKSLIAPAFAWNLVWIILLFVLYGANPFCDVYKAALSFFNGEDMPCGPAWFLISLFWVQLFAALVAERKTRLCGIVFLSVVWVAMKWFPFCYLGNAAMAFPFFFTGMLMKDVFVCRVSRKQAAFMSLCLGVLFLFVATCFGPVSLRCMAFGNFWAHPIHRPLNILVFYAAALVGLTSFIMFFRALDLPRCRIVEECSKGTIVFLCVHRFVRVTPLEHWLTNSLSSYTLDGFLIRAVVSFALMAACYLLYLGIVRVNCLSMLVGFRGSSVKK